MIHLALSVALLLFLCFVAVAGLRLIANILAGAKAVATAATRAIVRDVGDATAPRWGRIAKAVAVMAALTVVAMLLGAQ